MSNIEDKLDLDNKIREIIKSNEITDEISEVVVKDAGLKGEGMVSQTRYVTVKFLNEDKKPLNLFLKIHTESESHTQMIGDIKAFEKEARFLIEYLPAAEEFCGRKGMKHLMEIYPKCYYADGTMTLLENLVLDKGFALLDKTERQDIEAASLATVNLASLHALSYALIREVGGPQKFFERFPDLDLECYNNQGIIQLIEPSFANAITTNSKIVEKNHVEGAEEALEFIQGLIGTSYDKATDARNYEQMEDEIFVLCHGDYWNNNMLFLKDESGKYIAHKAIDFQITRYNSPILDLSYYFFTSIKKDVRQEHLKDLLDLYLNTFKKITKELGYPVEWTSEQFFYQYRRRFAFGYWFAFLVTLGPGMAVSKGVDVNKIDMKDWAQVYLDLVQSWLEKNPELGKGYAEEIVSVIREYKRLSL